ncbi:hypothetical protein DP43_2253 [Burkholderia pseudomallei]|nr:hypothetical protein DP43_2253 [Burkholderia pseudomallei]
MPRSRFRFFLSCVFMDVIVRNDRRHKQPGMNFRLTDSRLNLSRIAIELGYIGSYLVSNRIVKFALRVILFRTIALKRMTISSPALNSKISRRRLHVLIPVPVLQNECRSAHAFPALAI